MDSSVMAPMLQSMDKTVQSLKADLVKVRTGRASTALLDSVQLDYYGSRVPLSQVANLTTPDAKTIQIIPWEVSTLGGIEKAILAANLGLTPQNDGKLVRISVPPMTQERRKEMVKLVKKMGEESKIAIRNHRREMNEVLKKQKNLSEDDVKKALDQVQKKTDEKIAEVDVVIASKEKDILSV
jgi:ribosome recycling factor